MFVLSMLALHMHGCLHGCAYLDEIEGTRQQMQPRNGGNTVAVRSRHLLSE